MGDLNRRHFFMGGLAAAAAVRPGLAQRAGETIRTGIIGTGNRGWYVMRGVMEQPGARVVAVCDIKPDRLDKAASIASRDNPKTYTDYRRLLEQPDLDAVIIATPCDLHVEQSIAALNAGKHVYCEKPIGIHSREIGQLVKVAKASPKVFQAGQQRRSEVRLARTIQKIHEGAAGEIVMIRAQRHAGNDLAHDGPSADWFFNASRSGDVIVEMSVHNLDVCNWVADSRPVWASGLGGTLVWVNEPPGRTNMDGYSLNYEYANGVKLSYMQTFFHPSGLPAGGQFTHVYTSTGAVDLDSSTFYSRARNAQPAVLVDKVEEDRHAHMADFIEAIRTGKKPNADIMVGAVGALTAILGREAIYRKTVMSWRDLAVEL